ncbi:hypothetical protein LARI1_G006676 [Lachnellula arida]|uniref:Uncharacterized protein n=1 Tax=Lachnellula arida TaxID=1316785 RepID=A0A8T9BAU3_9HELO|nr:hypothetical protein LARI1_G006676 [Lachnellula arida]
MAVTTQLLLLASLHVLSVAAQNNPTTQGVKWLEKGRSVLVRLSTPDLPLWNKEEQIGEDIPSALILNFTVSADNKTLLLQDQPFMPPHTPPRLSAPQTSQSLSEFEHGTTLNLEDLPVFDLDYDRIAHPRDDPSIHYYNYYPKLMINLLGAGVAGHNALLKDMEQKVIKITLRDWNTVRSASTDPPNHSFEIKEVKLWERQPGDSVNPDDLKACTLKSWRCSDFGDHPWYRYIFRQNFDEYGKIGSFRHMLHQRWATLYERLGFFRITLLILVVASVILLPIPYALYKGGQWINAQHRARVEASAAVWKDNDEEVEGLLFADESLENMYGSEETESKEVFSEKQVDGNEAEGSAEKPLPPVTAKTADAPEASEK